LASTTAVPVAIGHVGKALFQSDLDFMAKTIRSKGANPIFGTSTSGQSCSGSTNVANRGFGPETKAAGAADKCAGH